MTRAAPARRGQATAHPGRPRDPGRDRAILDATLALLAEEGYAHLSIEAVAHRAGVGKPTVYRRWRSKAELVIDAIGSLPQRMEVPPAGLIRERLVALVSDLAATARRPQRRLLMAGLLAEIPRDPELAAAMREAFVAKRRRVLFVVLDDGVASGELRPDLDRDVAADLLVAPVLLRILVTGQPATPAFAAAVVDAFLDGVGSDRA